MRIAYSQLEKLHDPGQIYSRMILACGQVIWVQAVLTRAWADYMDDLFKYDAATFVTEHKGEFWEVAAFIHDWLNGIGYVGREPDIFFLEIMDALNYSSRMKFERCKWMQWRWINVLKHKYWNRDFKGDCLPTALRSVEAFTLARFEKSKALNNGFRQKGNQDTPGDAC